MDRKNKDKPQSSATVRRSNSARSAGPRTGTPSKRAGGTPTRRGAGTPQRKSTGSSMPSTDRVGMLIMEANEISQYLHRTYIFSRAESPTENDLEAHVKVTNTKLSLSCLWSLTKLKERLMRMRKLMYAGEADTSGISGESVFYDPNDIWVNEGVEILVAGGQNGLPNGNHGNPTPASNPAPPSEQQHIPNLSNGGVATPTGTSMPESPLRRSRSLSLTGELPGDSQFLMAPMSTGGLPEKYLTSSGSFVSSGQHDQSSTTVPAASAGGPRVRHSPVSAPARPSESSKVTQPPAATRHARWTVVTPKPIRVKPAPPPTAMIALCKDIVGLSMDKLQGPSQKCSTAEKIVYNCESVKLAVINILGAYIQALDRTPTDIRSFAESELVRVTSMQLVAAMELLVSHVSLWSLSLQHMESETIQHLTAAIQTSVRELGALMVTFLQGCEKEDDSVAQDSASKLIDVICQLVQSCGELALATDLHSDLLLADLPTSQSRDDDLLAVKAGVDLKQAFLIGCDTFVDRSLSAGVRTLEEYEEEVQGLTHDCPRGAQLAHDVVKHVDIVIATCKILLLKCQEVQVELNASMKDDSAKKPDYFQHYFVRCSLQVNQVNTVLDSVCLLLQASEPLLDDSDPGTLQKISRCGELVQRATDKLTGASNTETSLASSNTADSQTPRGSLVNGLALPDFSAVLTEAQCEQLSNAGQDIRRAVHALLELIRKNLPQGNVGNSGRMKRMLPATPGGRRPLVRCHSARGAEHRISRNIALVDYGQGGNNL